MFGDIVNVLGTCSSVVDLSLYFYFLPAGWGGGINWAQNYEDGLAKMAKR